MKKVDELIIRIDELIEQADYLLKTAKVGYSEKLVDDDLFYGFKVNSLAFLNPVFGKDHINYIEFSETVNINYEKKVKAGKEILKAARNQMEKGWVFDFKTLVCAEIFSDFLEMSEHLLDTGYKDAAAVMIGSVLEENLRIACAKNDISTVIIKDGKEIPLKADTLNANLVKANCYNKTDQKCVTSWLGFRNDAAHGHYDNYSKEEVKLMLNGVSLFISKLT